MQELEAHSCELPPFLLGTLNFRIYGALSHTFYLVLMRTSLIILILLIGILRQNGDDIIVTVHTY